MFVIETQVTRARTIYGPAAARGVATAQYRQPQSRAARPEPVPSARIVAVDTVARADGWSIRAVEGALNPRAKIGVSCCGYSVISIECVSVKRSEQSGPSPVFDRGRTDCTLRLN